MALSRFVVGTTVTLPPGTGTAGNFGTESWAVGSGATAQWANGIGATFRAGEVIYGDSSAPGTTPTGAQQLYQALTTAGANLRAFIPGQDDVGHAALAN